MVEPSDITHLRTREIIEDLFLHPPVNEAELRKRLRSIDKPLARRLTVDKLHEGNVPERAGTLFLAILNVLGAGHQRRRLMRLALDQSLNARDRLFAAMTVTAENPSVMDTLLDELGADGMGVLAELSLFELMSLDRGMDVGDPIAITLENLIENQSVASTLKRIEAYRLGIGLPCDMTYRESLTRDALSPLRKNILDNLVEEGSEAGISLLSELRDSARDESARRDFQSALLKLRSDRIDPKRTRPPFEGQAHMSNCDGQGDFILLGCFENLDGTHTVADLCVRAGAEIRDAAVHARLSEHAVAKLVSDISAQIGCQFVTVPMEVAAGIVVAAKDRTRHRIRMSREAEQAISLFERTYNGLAETMEKAPSSDVSFEMSRDAVRELLSRPEYSDTWFFDSGDLGGLKIQSHSDEPPMEFWSEEQRQNWFKGSPVHRLVAMANHMANFHLWNGEQKEALLLEAAARSVLKDKANSPLTQVMLERSIGALRDAATELSCFFGDSTIRQRLKMLFFKDVTVPKGRDLARLDFVEASASALSVAFDLLPGDRRPTESVRDVAAYELGKIFADHIVQAESVVPDYSVPLMNQALEKVCWLNDSERHKVIMTVVPSLYSFVEEVCSVCPVNCLKRPADDLSDVFFTPYHPLAPERFGWSSR